MVERPCPEDVVPEYERDAVRSHEVATDEEGLRDPRGLRLHRVADMDAPLLAVLEEAVEERRVVRGRYHQHFADAREHQRRERVVHHRLVVDGHQLLAHDERGGMQA